MARIQEALACRYHRLAVSWVAGTLVLDRQQMGIALPRDIETVTGRAAPRLTLAMHRVPVQRTGQRGKRNEGHGATTCS